MDPIVGGALIGGGASLLGQAGSIGAGFGMQAASQQFAEDFAKMKIRWMAKDLEKAGFNRVLAATSATGGSGGAAGGAFPSPVSGMEGARAGSEVALRRKQNELVEAQTRQAEAGAAHQAEQAASIALRNNYLYSEEGQKMLKSGMAREFLGSNPMGWLPAMFGDDIKSFETWIRNMLPGGQSPTTDEKSHGVIRITPGPRKE